jgi:HTH-type transcriptional regulator / antitoxin HipB
VNYPLQTLSQLRPVLQGFRKANNLTQAALAQRLGVTQQTYAQLEANPASASVERLFKVLRALDVELWLSHSPLTELDVADAVVRTQETQLADPAQENW